MTQQANRIAAAPLPGDAQQLAMSDQELADYIQSLQTEQAQRQAAAAEAERQRRIEAGEEIVPLHDVWGPMGQIISAGGQKLV